MTQTIAIIPARYGSTRFPGKPMASVAGMSLLERVWRLTKAAASDGQCLDGVYIATDYARLADHAASFGAETIMTPTNCANGTERAAAAIEKLVTQPDYIVNVQGDAVLTPPWVISAVAKALPTSNADIVTPAVTLSWESAAQLRDSKRTTPGSGTLVVTNKTGRALYFSKEMIPHIRKPDHAKPCPYQRHIGLYGYSRSALQTMTELPSVVLEEAEGLEQLRALHHGLSIQVVPVDYQGRSHGSIDSPEDVTRVEAIIEAEGELI